MYDYNYDEFKQNVLDFLYESEDIPESVKEIAKVVAMDIYTEIVDHRTEIRTGWRNDLRDCRASAIAFDLMTVICFSSEFKDSLDYLTMIESPDNRERFSIEFGIPDTILDLIVQWQSCKKHYGICIGIEQHLPDHWCIDCADLTAWKNQQISVH